MRLRGVEPPRTFRSTRPSTLRVYQFRHSRVGARILVGLHPSAEDPYYHERVFPHTRPRQEGLTWT